MGCPAGVANTDVCVGDWRLLEIFNQNRELSCALSGLQPSILINYRYASGVIASIFQAL
jgi:hypothetical protein